MSVAAAAAAAVAVAAAVASAAEGSCLPGCVGVNPAWEGPSPAAEHPDQVGVAGQGPQDRSAAVAGQG